MGELLEEHAHPVTLGVLEQIREAVEEIHGRLSRADEFGAIDAIQRLSWAAGGSADFNERGNFRSVVILNENAFAVTVGLAPGAGARGGQAETFTLPPNGFILLPARTVTVSVGAAQAGAATVIPLAVTMPFTAGTLSGGGSSSAPSISGGEFLTTLPTLADTQTSPLMFDSRGGLLSVLKDGAGTIQARVLQTNADAQGTLNGLVSASWPYAWNGTGWDRMRAPNVFKSNDGTNADITIWTPGAGKKFRLIRWCLFISGNAALAAPGVNNFRLKDGATAFTGAFDLFMPGAAGAGLGGFISPWMDWGPNGYLSTAANNVLALTFGTNLSAGFVGAMAIGTEE